jgi:hypothetical protein
MAESASPLLTPWSNFYVMTGSSAAALTGLVFVVITLVNRAEQLQTSKDGIAAYSTPTVMHFCAALFTSATLAAPWRSLGSAGILIAIAALGGVVYILRVTYISKRLTAYTPDFEDWMWYTILPFAAYAVMLTAALALFAVPAKALFVVAGGIVLLIFIGIRNAWDVVTFIATGGPLKPLE